MIRTIGTLAATVALVAATATGASATTSDTTHSTNLNSAIPATCVGPGWTSWSGTGQSVQHLTVNNAGDSWYTETQQGQVTLWTTTVDGVTSWTGHVQEWFGAEDNNKNSVQHATFNFQGVSTSDPSKSLSMHAAFTATTNANGVLVVNNETITCN